MAPPAAGGGGGGGGAGGAGGGRERDKTKHVNRVYRLRADGPEARERWLTAVKSATRLDGALVECVLCYCYYYYVIIILLCYIILLC